MFQKAWIRKGLRILVVDSVADSRDLLTGLFGCYEIETTTATCVREAIEALQQTRPDLLISEIFLPEEDGFSLISQVKAFETTYGTRIPAIALTVCTEERTRIRVLTSGFCRHLSKPLDIDELMETVACITGQIQLKLPVKLQFPYGD